MLNASEENRIRISMQYFADDGDKNTNDSADSNNSDSGNSSADNKQTGDNNQNTQNNQNNQQEEEESKVDVSEIFGMSEEAIKKLIAEKKAKDDANKDAETKLNEALEEKAKAEAKVSAMMLGAKPDCVDDVITLATAKSNDGKQFKTVISEIKKKHPDMFTNGNEEPGKKGTGNSIGNGKKSGDSSESIATRLAKSKRKNQKSSFFGK